MTVGKVRRLRLPLPGRCRLIRCGCISTRMVAPEVEALYVLDASALEGGLWQPNDPRYVCPVLMHLVDGRWLVRNLGSESDPATTT